MNEHLVVHATDGMGHRLCETPTADVEDFWIEAACVIDDLCWSCVTIGCGVKFIAHGRG